MASIRTETGTHQENLDTWSTFLTKKRLSRKTRTLFNGLKEGAVWLGVGIGIWKELRDVPTPGSFVFWAVLFRSGLCRYLSNEDTSTRQPFWKCGPEETTWAFCFLSFTADFHTTFGLDVNMTRIGFADDRNNMHKCRVTCVVQLTGCLWALYTSQNC